MLLNVRCMKRNVLILYYFPCEKEHLIKYRLNNVEVQVFNNISYKKVHLNIF